LNQDGVATATLPNEGGSAANASAANLPLRYRSLPDRVGDSVSQRDADIGLIASCACRLERQRRAVDDQRIAVDRQA
jgi:hypothetical protein